ncbi:ABC transporter ATP-binding protein [Paenibacillus aquistagni]|uniref:ABC transporter ATP-binding protein n=1 Tax=Paenibacillus aquistagni TaxID=1852522 RepID=UPI00145A8059|nr:ABC transporter ATP-binding protein [Paenibacillus aquistagni]NMM54838.1 ABC transporter ATP-binding protein [Paenibacillus aquistagni]
MESLVINKLSKSYRNVEALKSIDLNISPGVFGLLGPNGAGKSTLMRILATLISADAGDITFGNVSWNNPSKVRSMIGYLPQNFSIYRNMKVFEALDHLAMLKGMNKQKRKEQIATTLEQVNLLDCTQKKIKELSGGMVRRVGIAQAILGDPKIIIVDEPTAGLDPEERIRFRSILQSISSEKTIILSSHIVEDIEILCNQIGILHKGRLLINGSLDVVKKVADGQVWSTEVDNETLLELSNNQIIISQIREGDRFKVRVLSSKAPNENAFQVRPTIEDAYYLCMQESVSK